MSIYVVRISRGDQWIEVVREARNSAVAAQDACDECEASIDELDWAQPVWSKDVGRNWLKNDPLKTGTVKAGGPTGARGGLAGKGGVMMKRAVVISGPYRVDWKDEEIDASLEGLQRIVGGLIELLPIDSEQATVFCHEEGKVLHLPGTAQWHENGRVHDVIAGPCVVLGPVDDEGDTLALTDEALAYVKTILAPLIPEARMEFIPGADTFGDAA